MALNTRTVTLVNHSQTFPEKLYLYIPDITQTLSFQTPSTSQGNVQVSPCVSRV